jgi:hypothetical protein
MDMKTDYDGLFGHMCDFSSQPPLLFAIPELTEEMYERLARTTSPVELVVPDLDAFCVPEEDLERIQWAVEAAMDWE